jgi:hypothetical protein
MIIKRKEHLGAQRGEIQAGVCSCLLCEGAGNLSFANLYCPLVVLFSGVIASELDLFIEIHPRFSSVTYDSEIFVQEGTNKAQITSSYKPLQD